MARRYNYRQRTIVKSDKDGQYELKEQKLKIKKIELSKKDGYEVLNITTENGTRCTISQKDDYRYDLLDWIRLKKCLRPGDFVKVESTHLKIIRSTVEFSYEYFRVEYAKKLEHQILMTLRNKEREISVEIKDSPDELITLENCYGNQMNFDNFDVKEWKYQKVIVYSVGNRIAHIEIYLEV